MCLVSGTLRLDRHNCTRENLEKVEFDRSPVFLSISNWTSKMF